MDGIFESVRDLGRQTCKAKGFLLRVKITIKTTSYDAHQLTLQAFLDNSTTLDTSNLDKSKSTRAGLEPTRVTPTDFESVALTTSTHFI